MTECPSISELSEKLNVLIKEIEQLKEAKSTNDMSNNKRDIATEEIENILKQNIGRNVAIHLIHPNVAISGTINEVKNGILRYADKYYIRIDQIAKFYFC